MDDILFMMDYFTAIISGMFNNFTCAIVKLSALIIIHFTSEELKTFADGKRGNQ